MRVELTESFNKCIKRFSENVRNQVISKLDELVTNRCRALKLVGRLSKYSSLRVSRELFVIVKHVPEQKLVRAYGICRRESLVEELREILESQRGSP